MSQELTFREQFLQLVEDTRAQTPNAARYGWRHTTISDQQRDYIIARERVLEAIKVVQKLDWQSIDLNDKELAGKIRENTLHALGTLARAMQANEEAMMWV